MNQSVDKHFVRQFAKEVYATSLKYETELECERKRSIIREKNKKIIYGVLNCLQETVIRLLQVYMIFVNILCLVIFAMLIMTLLIANQCFVCQVHNTIDSIPWHDVEDYSFLHKILYTLGQSYTDIFAASTMCRLMGTYNLSCAKIK